MTKQEAVHVKLETSSPKLPPTLTRVAGPPSAIKPQPLPYTFVAPATQDRDHRGIKRHHPPSALPSPSLAARNPADVEAVEALRLLRRTPVAKEKEEPAAKKAKLLDVVEDGEKTGTEGEKNEGSEEKETVAEEKKAELVKEKEVVILE